ncbi:MAG: phosphonate C-P lyase system protein PhnH [Pseudomonadota bacterium]
MTAISGTFADPARDGARAFRAILDAMARPGRIQPIDGPNAGELSPAAAAILLTLADTDAPVWLANDAARPWLSFHCGAPMADKSECMFAVGRWESLAPLDPYQPGTPDFPDRSATLIVEMDELTAEGAALSGPGIDGTISLSLPDPAAMRASNARFPLGLDFILCAGSSVACLPRSTRIA